LLLGCYRTGEANDPQTYVAAIAAVLARYPEDVMTSVTHPVTGLPSKTGWLPTIKEVTDACNVAVEPIRQHEARLKRIKEQMEMRERMECGEKPTLEQLKEKYGPNWGLDPIENQMGTTNHKIQKWDEIVEMYSSDPSRIESLTR